jgi:hypothetical protein
MCRKIFITNKDIKPDIKIISIEEFYDGKTGIDNEYDCFDDTTLNFEDLNIWNAEKDLHKKNVNEIKITIKKILTNLKNIGYLTRIISEKDQNSNNWINGHTDIVCNSINKIKMYGRDYFDLSKDEKIPILMFHLENIYEILSDYDNTYFCILD